MKKIEETDNKEVTSNIEEKTTPIRKRNRKLMWLITLFFGALFLTSTYAWFSTSLNVKIKFINMKVNTDSGLFISLDGVNFSDEIEVNSNSILYEIKDLYPNHINRWALNGLWTVSSNGLSSSLNDKMDFYFGAIGKYKSGPQKGEYYLRTIREKEEYPVVTSSFIAFDIFLKNASGSPRPDNLFLTENTFFEFDEKVDQETRDAMSGIMNSVRLGIVRIGSVPIGSSVSAIQNVGCDSTGCKDLIFEPFSRLHSEKSINDASERDITLVNGEYYPTYGIISEGDFLDHKQGYYNQNSSIDRNYFDLQETWFEEDLLETPIFQIPNGILKLRVYVWVEGQDVDSIETRSKGAPINLNIEILKDLAGYTYYND